MKRSLPVLLALAALSILFLVEQKHHAALLPHDAAGLTSKKECIVLAWYLAENGRRSEQSLAVESACSKYREYTLILDAQAPRTNLPFSGEDGLLLSDTW